MWTHKCFFSVVKHWREENDFFKASFLNVIIFLFLNWTFNLPVREYGCDETKCAVYFPNRSFRVVNYLVQPSFRQIHSNKLKYHSQFQVQKQRFKKYIYMYRRPSLIADFLLANLLVRVGKIGQICIFSSRKWTYICEFSMMMMNANIEGNLYVVRIRQQIVDRIEH